MTTDPEGAPGGPAVAGRRNAHHGKIHPGDADRDVEGGLLEDSGARYLGGAADPGGQAGEHRADYRPLGCRGARRAPADRAKRSGLPAARPGPGSASVLLRPAEGWIIATPHPIK